MARIEESDPPAATLSGFGAFLRRGGAALVVAVVVNALVVTAANAIELAPGLEPLAIGPVILFTALGVAGATMVFAAISRVAPHPRRTFVIVAAVVLVVSIVPDVVYVPTMANATAAGAAALAVMHVTTAVIAVGILLGPRRL